MNKIRSTVSTVVNALRYSFAFCLRNNRRDTIQEFKLTLTLAILGYVMVRATGDIITAIQGYLTGPHTSSLTVTDLVRVGFILPATCFIVAKYLAVILQKAQGVISRRRGHVLRNAHTMEAHRLKSSLDIGRVHSQSADDLRRQINDLPQGWFTRISFANSSMEILGDVASLAMFGAALVISHPVYFFVIVCMCMPMIATEFAAVNKDWKLSKELLPLNKRRSVLEGAFQGHTSFAQGLMFNQMPALLRSIRSNFDEIEGRYDELRNSSAQMTLYAQLLAITALCGVFIHAAWHTLTARGDIGSLTILIASSDRLVGSIRGIIRQLASQWISAKGVIMIEEQFFGMKPLVVTDDPVEPKFDWPPTIRFDKVCAKYPDQDTLVLKDVTFEIASGERVVVIGKNGGGKSTLLSVLLRFMDPVSGDVSVGGVSLRRIMPVVWYRSIVALTQRFVIHDRTIGDEVASSDLDATKDMGKIERAARFAEFMSVVESRSSGFATQLGTELGGVDLSGGEERRLALARVMYRDTKVLVFDEPEANLDPEAAHAVLARIFALKGHTVIVATQRVSEAVRADRILFMKNGELVGNGPHHELIESCEPYRKLFQRDIEDRRRERSDSD